MLAPWMQERSVERYRAAFNKAINKQQYETANLFLKKLDSLPGDRSESTELKFNRAVLDIGLGRTAAGMAVLSQLAPDDSFGYGPAHLWLAQKFISADPSISGDNGHTVVHHLKSALRDTPDNKAIQMALGHYYYRTDSPANAIKYLTPMAGEQPELHFVIANLHSAIGDQELAEKHFELAAEMLTERLTEYPGEVETRTNLAISQFKTGKIKRAIKTLVDGIDPANPDPALSQTLSSFYLAESDRLRQSLRPDEPEFLQSLVMLSHALNAAPNNVEAVNRIAAIASDQGPTAEKAVEVVKQLLTEGKMTATAHLILGTASLQKGNTERAKRHYGQAYALDPKMPALLNNIAWVLAHEDPPQPAKSLEIINLALANANRDNPIIPYMLDTRGQIYLQLERWNEALIDLERALTDMPDNPGVHKALAIAYRNLGEPGLANEHEKLAAKLEVNK